MKQYRCSLACTDRWQLYIVVRWRWEWINLVCSMYFVAGCKLYVGVGRLGNWQRSFDSLLCIFVLKSSSLSSTLLMLLLLFKVYERCWYISLFVLVRRCCPLNHANCEQCTCHYCCNHDTELCHRCCCSSAFGDSMGQFYSSPDSLNWWPHFCTGWWSGAMLGLLVVPLANYQTDVYN
jgi:hypothetical protein